MRASLAQIRPWNRLTSTVCQRAFSSPEAFLYEVTVAPAVAAIVGPVIASGVRGAVVLDVGCGGGRVAEMVADSRQSVMVAIDPSASQTARVARRKGRALTPCRAAAGHLPFRDASFDAVYSSCALKHWPSPAEGLAECRRVARPGATVLIVEIDGGSTPDEVRAFTRRTRIPLGLRAAYVRFAMRTVVAVAPDQANLAAAFEGTDLALPAVDKLQGLPFLIARATAP
jgi:SAM-dependent methyltransferase